MSLIHVPPGVTVLAMDVHKNSISTGVLEPGSSVALVDKISSDDEMVREFAQRLVGEYHILRIRQLTCGTLVYRGSRCTRQHARS